jgi:DNA-binding NtrC family response regulator
LETQNRDPNFVPERLIFGRSITMQEVRKSVLDVADASVPVLLVGEPGTGKEVIGRKIHRLSPWCSDPFMEFPSSDPVKAQSKAGSGQRSAQFPWESSSLSDNRCNRCTLFIREVSDLSAPLQAKLLEVFQDRSPAQTDSPARPPENVRVICSSTSNLEEQVASGSFRLDLFYRINVVTISVPALRDRKEDLPDLVEYFFESSCRERNSSCPRLPGDLLQLFSRHDWPGNIRELENCVRIFVNTDGNAALAEAFISKRRKSAGHGKLDAPLEGPIPLKTFTRQLVEQAERDLILRVLHQQRWNRKETAKVLQVSYQTLLHKLKQVGLSRKRRVNSEIVDQQVQE